MSKFNLRMSITGSQLNLYGLPIDSLTDHGVIFVGCDNVIVGDGKNKENKIVYSFTYIDEYGTNKQTQLEKSVFESFFEPAND